MDKNPLSSRKITNRLPSREGNPNKESVTLNSTGDNFFRKSGKGFYSYRPENHGIIKSDLFQIQDLINESSHMIKMFKLSSKSSTLNKKLSEIEENRDMKYLIDRIIEDATNVDRTGKLYNCSSSGELIQKLSLDLFYLELLLKKVNEYFVILMLQTGGEDESFGIGDSFSKFVLIKLVIEKLLDRPFSTTEQQMNLKENVSTVIDTNVSSGNNLFSNEFQNEILKVNNIFEFTKKYTNSENEVISHIANLTNDFLNKMNSNYSELINKYNKTKHDGNLQLEGFLTQKLIIEKIICDKDKLINEANAELVKLKELLNESTNSVKLLNSDIQAKEEEFKNYKNNFNANTSQNIPQNNSHNNQSLSKLIEESNRTLLNYKKTDELTLNKLYDEMKELSAKYDLMKSQYDILQKEKEEVEKKNAFLSKNQKKDADFQSYEELMQEQFDVMKSSFMKKIEEMNEDINKVKIESRRKVNSLQEDLTKANYIKEIFLKQITELQKQNS